MAGQMNDNCYTTLAGPIGSATNSINYALIDGFYIQDGNANGTTYFTRQRGGGFFSFEYVVKTDIRNCVFKNNFASVGGAFAAISFQVDKTVNFESCIFEGNTSTAGIMYYSGTNSKDITSTMSNCLITDNTTNTVTSATNPYTTMYVDVKSGSSTDVNILNSTSSDNHNTYSGTNKVASIIVYAQSTSGAKNVIIDNSIFWKNTDDDDLVRMVSSGNPFTSVKVKNSISNLTSTETFYTATNVLTSDPLFTAATTGDFTLKAGSPAIDAGSQTGLAIPSSDLAGNKRVAGTQIDMGCYESGSTAASIANAKSNLIVTGDSAKTSIIAQN